VIASLLLEILAGEGSEIEGTNSDDCNLERGFPGPMKYQSCSIVVTDGEFR
jgi:hypothetical protein